MNLVFNEKKATQATAYILDKLGGTEYYIKLIKLLYIADRKAIAELGLPITSDHYVSMDKGPVLSAIYNLINEGPSPDVPSIWHDFISPPKNYRVSLDDNPGTGSLNQYEKEILDKVVQEFGSWNRWDLIDYCHRFPEYQDPHGSSIPITIDQILNALNKGTEEKRLINRKIEFANDLQLMLNSD